MGGSNHDGQALSATDSHIESVGVEQEVQAPGRRLTIACSQRMDGYRCLLALKLIDSADACPFSQHPLETVHLYVVGGSNQDVVGGNDAVLGCHLSVAHLGALIGLAE